MHEIRGKILVKTRQFFKRYTSMLDNAIVHRVSRDEAHTIRQLHIKKRGGSVVDKKLKKQIREYSRDRFGTPSYWPWLALYTEIRGEFKEHWIPVDYYRFHLLPKWNPEDEISRLKTFDHRLFGDFALEPLAVKIGSHFYDSAQNKIDTSDLPGFLKSRFSEIVIKSDGSSSGKKVRFVNRDDLSSEDLDFEGNAVVQPVLEQHRELDRLHSSSVNTLRIVTFLDDDSGKAVLKFVALRFGINGVRVDNTSQGGNFLMLNENGKVITNAFDENGIITGHRHPDTGIVYKTLEIPSVKQAGTLCCEAHHKFPYMKFIAWDVAVDKEGVPVLLEWNARNPGMWHEEAFLGPLWPDL